MYDLSRLRGRIIEKCGTLKTFAEEMNISQVSLSNKLNGRSVFTQAEITKAVDVLDIAAKDIGTYFFTLKVK